jgi:putative NADH-flavin reductase
MKVAIFGSTGRTGVLILEEALKAGYSVAAFARDPEKLGIEHALLTVCQGELLDREAVAEAVHGAGAVISALGPASNKPEFTISRSMQGILAGMQQHGVKRLIVTAGAGIDDSEDAPTIMSRLMEALVKTVARNVYEDMLRVAGLVRASDLDWTIVRTPMLTDQPKVGKVKVAWVGKGMQPRVTRGDLAAFIVSQVEDQTYLRRSPAVSN